MNTREQAAYNAGIEAVRHAAMIAAVSIEAGPNARELRHQAAAAALHGLAEGASALRLGGPADAAAHAPALIQHQPVPQPKPPAALTDREIATARGFTGDTCATCGSFAMKRAGTCLTCQACGSTTGCA